MNSSNGQRDLWWRFVVLPGRRRILDSVVWRERWQGKPYQTPPKLKSILAQLKKEDVDSAYIEWLLLPESLKGGRGHPVTRLPVTTQQEILEIFDQLDALLKTMRELVDRRHLPGKRVEEFRRWLLSCEKDVEPVCPLIASYSKIMKDFKGSRPEFFRGRPPDERVRATFLISEELRRSFPHRYWPTIAEIIQTRFPAEASWCTPAQLSRAVGRLKNRVGENKARGIVRAYREWFIRYTRKQNSLTARRGTQAV